MTAHRTLRTLAGVWAVFATASPASLAAQEPGPRFETDRARAIVERMVAAHGGMDAWRNAPSFRYTANMYLASLDVWGATGRRYYDNWRYYTVTIEPSTSRGYVHLPLERGDGPKAGFDGTQVWGLPYDFDRRYRESPFALLFFHYGYVALPWLTQSPGTVLSYQGERVFPNGTTRFHHVRMAFEPAGKTHEGHIDLYIDQRTNLLTGWGGTQTFPIFPGDFLPAVQRAGGGGLVRLVESFQRAGPLIVPLAYVTVRFDEDGTEMLGTHLVVDASVSEPFDASLVAPPAGAEISYTVDGN